MRPDVWVPEAIPAAERARLEQIAIVHVFAPAGPLPDGSAPADLLVAAYDTGRALQVASRFGRLGAIQAFSAGVDSVLDQVPAGVTLCDAAGVHDVPVAEWVVMTILASCRRLPEHLASQRAGVWRTEAIAGRDLVDATVVLLGVGAIGRAVQERLTGFGPRIIRVARRAREGVHPLAGLPAILPGADVVVIMLPLTPETRGLVDAAFLAAMPAGALLVNASRGAIVDTTALTQAVLAGRIRVALDVTDPEPLPEGHPLWSATGAIVTPHVASDVAREDERGWQLVFDQVTRLSRGEPLANVVIDGY